MPTTLSALEKGMSGKQRSTHHLDISSIWLCLLVSLTPLLFLKSLVNDVLRGVIGRFVFVYVDDILIFSKDIEAHKQHVHQVIQSLLENKVFVKAEKCEFHVSSVTLLDYIIAQGQLRMDPAKVRAVRVACARESEAVTAFSGVC